MFERIEEGGMTPRVREGETDCVVHGWCQTVDEVGRPTTAGGCCSACFSEINSSDFVSCGEHGIQPKSKDHGCCPFCRVPEITVETSPRGADAAEPVSGGGVPKDGDDALGNGQLQPGPSALSAAADGRSRGGPAARVHQPGDPGGKA